MSLPLSNSEQNLHESLNTPMIGGAPGDENIRLNEERSIIASTIALHGVQVCHDNIMPVSFGTAFVNSVLL